jgi:hypothetical protein
VSCDGYQKKAQIIFQKGRHSSPFKPDKKFDIIQTTFALNTLLDKTERHYFLKWALKALKKNDNTNIGINSPSPNNNNNNNNNNISPLNDSDSFVESSSVPLFFPLSINQEPKDKSVLLLPSSHSLEIASSFSPNSLPNFFMNSENPSEPATFSLDISSPTPNLSILSNDPNEEILPIDLNSSPKQELSNTTISQIDGSSKLVNLELHSLSSSLSSLSSSVSNSNKIVNVKKKKSHHHDHHNSNEKHHHNKIKYPTQHLPSYANTGSISPFHSTSSVPSSGMVIVIEFDVFFSFSFFYDIYLFKSKKCTRFCRKVIG